MILSKDENIFFKTAFNQIKPNKEQQEIFEKILAQDSQSAYQDLTHLLFLLWDRGLLENDDDIRKSFFPHKRIYIKLNKIISSTRIIS